MIFHIVVLRDNRKPRVVEFKAEDVLSAFTRCDQEARNTGRCMAFLYGGRIGEVDDLALYRSDGQPQGEHEAGPCWCGKIHRVEV